MSEADPRAMDVVVGGDGDVGGVAQPITVADVDAIVLSGAPIETRRANLMELQETIGARDHADFGDDMDVLLARITDALETLEDGADGVAVPGALGLNADNRVDAVPPDEIVDVLEEKL